MDSTWRARAAGMGETMITLKGLRRLWWNGVKRVSKVQQRQSRKLVKDLLKVSKIKPLSKPKSKPRARPQVKQTSSRVGPARARARPAAVSSPAAGLWSRSYYTSSLVDGLVPPRRMEYWLFVPDGIKKSAIPLVVMLHGCEQSAAQFAQGTRMNSLAARKGFAVLYPQQSGRANLNRCWNWYDKSVQEGGGEVRMIAGIIQKVIGKYPIDQTRIYVGGMSAGAAMASILALHYPQLVAAVGLHSGAVPGAAQSPLGAVMVMQRGARGVNRAGVHSTLGKAENASTMPAILIHGQRDYVVRSVNMAQAAQQFRIWNRLGGDSDDPVISEYPRVAGASRSRNAYKTYDYYDNKKLMVRVCEISQLGHAWSGGDASVRFNVADGPDASLLMWNFFRLHRRLPLAAGTRIRQAGGTGADSNLAAVDRRQG